VESSTSIARPLLQPENIKHQPEHCSNIKIASISQTTPAPTKDIRNQPDHCPIQRYQASAGPLLHPLLHPKNIKRFSARRSNLEVSSISQRIVTVLPATTLRFASK